MQWRVAITHLTAAFQRAGSHRPSGAVHVASALALVVLATPTVAGAQSVCVQCTGPDITYRCQVAGLDLGGLSGAGARLLCIKTLAKRGNHIRCAVDRNAKELCAGLSVTLSPDDAVDAVAPATDPAPENAPTPNTQPPAEDPENANSDAQSLPPAGYGPPSTPPAPIPAEAAGAEDAPDKPAPAADPGPPKTMEELAKRTAEQSGESIKKAGETVGSAAQKTWSCLTSFFTDC